MGNAYEIYALRYATMSPRTPSMNYLAPDPHETAAQDLDYFVWLIRGGGRDILVDTGFNAEEAQARARKLTLNPVDALERFGVKADNIRDVIVTHLHYDHAGNLDLFPNARFHLQDREMSYATGRCMCFGHLRHPFSIDHVTLMVRHVYGERVTFHSGDGQAAPGVTLHHVGGHSDGLQVVKVATARGPVVLASDASHFYGNFQRRSPFPIVSPAIPIASFPDMIRW
jgi:glyoxylase-like metal-dependent hydrolase (beta-lactamase superfamily II)